jgi:hypothetical protein
MERDEIVRKKLIKKSIKCRNRVIKSRGTKPVEKIKLNKISRDKIKKKIQTPKGFKNQINSN